MTKYDTRPVFVYACAKCQANYYTLVGRKPVATCGQCGCGSLYKRVIANPAQQTFDTAKREDAGRGRDAVLALTDKLEPESPEAVADRALGLLETHGLDAALAEVRRAYERDQNAAER